MLYFQYHRCPTVYNSSTAIVKPQGSRVLSVSFQANSSEVNVTLLITMVTSLLSAEFSVNCPPDLCDK